MIYTLSVEEKKAFHEDGFLIVPQLINQENIQELLNHTVGIMQGEVIVPGQIDPPQPDATFEEIEPRNVRIHQLHCHLEIHERYLLHARILDVLEGLIGPDVMAMQSPMKPKMSVTMMLILMDLERSQPSIQIMKYPQL